MKIILAQINVTVGNFEENFQKIKQEIQQAKLQAADLIIFPELAICGYPPRDFLNYDYFIQQIDFYIPHPLLQIEYFQVLHFHYN